MGYLKTGKQEFLELACSNQSHLRERIVAIISQPNLSSQQEDEVIDLITVYSATKSKSFLIDKKKYINSTFYRIEASAKPSHKQMLKLHQCIRLLETSRKFYGEAEQGFYYQIIDFLFSYNTNKQIIQVISVGHATRLPRTAWPV